MIGADAVSSSVALAIAGEFGRTDLCRTSSCKKDLGTLASTAPSLGIDLTFIYRKYLGTEAELAMC